MFDLILALAVGGAATWLLVYLVRLLIGAAGIPTQSAFERFGFRRCVERARQADQLIACGDTNRALPLLRQAFHLQITKDLKLAGTIANHHSGVLSRLINIVAESHGGTVRLLSLAKVDKLLNERRELQRSHIAARQSPGKQQRVRELTVRLEANRRELEPALEQLIAEVAAATRAPMTH